MVAEVILALRRNLFVTMTSINDLQGRSCKPCAGGTKPLSVDAAKTVLDGLPGWSLGSDGKTIGKVFEMKNFGAAIQFIGRIAELAEREKHHPDLHLTQYRKLSIELSTHAIGGLSENDLILAGKIEALPKELRKEP